MTDAVDLPPGEPDPARWTQVAIDRSNSGNLTSLTEAVVLFRWALAATPPGDPEQAGRVYNLSVALSMSFDRTGELAALTEAVQRAREAVAGTSPDGPPRGELLGSLGRLLLQLGRETGSLESLQECVTVARNALGASGSQDAEYFRLLANLANGLTGLGARTGDQNCLAEAVLTGRAAVRAMPPGTSDAAEAMSALSCALLALAERTGDSGMVEESLQLSKDAMDATPNDDPRHWGRFHMYVQAGLAMGRLTRHPGYCEVSAKIIRDRFLPLLPDQDWSRPAEFGSLGAAFFELFTLNQDAAVLAECVQASRAAVSGSPLWRADRASYNATLARALHRSYGQTGDHDVLAEAVQAARDAVAATPGDHPERASRLIILGNALRITFGPDGARNSAEASRCFAEALASAPAPVSVRVTAGRGLVEPAVWAGEAAGALAAYETMIELLPRLAPPGLPRADRERRWAEVAGIAGEAASVAIMAGRPEHAVELLERARSVLLSEALAARENTRPQVPARPGEDAATGPVIIVNVSQYRCDALITSGDAGAPVTLVPLPGFVLNEVREQGKRLRVTVDAAWGRSMGQQQGAQLAIHGILSWLWDRVAEPVLTALGFTDVPGPGQEWPRVWWCPIGEMSALPLHAAGHHQGNGDGPGGTPGPARTVMDRAISSYTPSVGVLRHIRQSARGSTAVTGIADSGELRAGALIIAMPDTPGASSGPLTRASAEARRLAQLMPGSEVLTAETATLSAALAALPRYRVAHFACHGITDWNDAESSRLLLYDHEEHPLTVARITELELADPELAYLSACTTSQTSPQLADQSVHISGAFQLIGYRHVIGTLWRVSDTAASVLADDFYTQLTGNGTVPPRTSGCAAALHHATRRLRDKYVASPLLWAGHIHTGV